MRGLFAFAGSAATPATAGVEQSYLVLHKTQSISSESTSLGVLPELVKRDSVEQVIFTHGTGPESHAYGLTKFCAPAAPAICSTCSSYPSTR